MALISRIPRYHTTRAFRTAARQRFEEAKRAAEVGDRLIGVYLCGYAAEMLLKAAYFRLIGKGMNDPIGIRIRPRITSRFDPTRSHAPRGNAVFDAPASVRLGITRDARFPVLRRGRGASRTAFPRRAWERVNSTIDRSDERETGKLFPA
jgi:hypothetical protein